MPATINSLATETLSEIFVHALHSQSNQEWCARTLQSLLLVCHRWNDIIEAYHELWTHLFISEQSAHYPSDSQSLFQSTSSRLRRSHKHPLDITIKVPIEPIPNVFDIHEAEMLGKILQKVASRVKHLEFSGLHFDLERAVLRQLGGTPMPLLSSFIHHGVQDPQLALFDMDNGDLELPVSLIEKQSYVLQHESIGIERESLNEWGDELYPNLHHVEILEGHFQWYRLPILRNIRRLSLRGSGIEVADLLDLLAPVTDSLRVLEVMDILCLEPDADDHWGEYCMVVENLQVLSLGYVHMEVPMLFFYHLDLPGLRDLTLTDMSRHRGTYDYDFPHNELLTHLIQFVPLGQLDRLTLNGVVFPNEEDHRVEIPHSGAELPAKELEHLRQDLRLPEEEFVAICGHWTMPLMVFFLHKFTGLKYLSLENLICTDGKANILEMLARYWQQGTLATLEVLHFDGPPEGVLDLLSAIEEEKVAGFRPLPLQVSVGEKLKSALSEEEKLKLERYINVLEMYRYIYI